MNDLSLRIRTSAAAAAAHEHAAKVNDLSLLIRFDPGYGYHVDNTTGIATGNEEESIYAVMSGNETQSAVRCKHAPI